MTLFDIWLIIKSHNFQKYKDYLVEVLGVYFGILFRCGFQKYSSLQFKNSKKLARQQEGLLDKFLVFRRVAEDFMIESFYNGVTHIIENFEQLKHEKPRGLTTTVTHCMNIATVILFEKIYYSHFRDSDNDVQFMQKGQSI